METNVKKKLTAREILGKTGPGIIMAAAAVGTGTVTTSAILGASTVWCGWYVLPCL